MSDERRGDEKWSRQMSCAVIFPWAENLSIVMAAHDGRLARYHSPRFVAI
jgi:hypothetical protein